MRYLFTACRRHRVRMLRPASSGAVGTTAGRTPSPGRTRRGRIRSRRGELGVAARPYGPRPRDHRRRCEGALLGQARPTAFVPARVTVLMPPRARAGEGEGTTTCFAPCGRAGGRRHPRRGAPFAVVRSPPGGRCACRPSPEHGPDVPEDRRVRHRPAAGRLFPGEPAHSGTPFHLLRSCTHRSDRSPI